MMKYLLFIAVVQAHVPPACYAYLLLCREYGWDQHWDKAPLVGAAVVLVIMGPVAVKAAPAINPWNASMIVLEEALFAIGVGLLSQVAIEQFGIGRPESLGDLADAYSPVK